MLVPVRAFLGISRMLIEFQKDRHEGPFSKTITGWVTLLHPMLQDLRLQNHEIQSMVVRLARLLHKYIISSFCGDVGIPEFRG